MGAQVSSECGSGSCPAVERTSARDAVLLQVDTSIGERLQISSSDNVSAASANCAARLNNYDKRNAACIVKEQGKGLLVYVPYGRPGWDFIGGTRHHGEYACETAEREACEESGHKVRTIRKISHYVFLCEIVQKDYCKKAVDEGFLQKRWVSRSEVWGVKYRPGSWGGNKAQLLHDTLR